MGCFPALNSGNGLTIQWSDPTTATLAFMAANRSTTDWSNTARRYRVLSEQRSSRVEALVAYSFCALVSMLDRKIDKSLLALDAVGSDDVAIAEGRWLRILRT